MQELIFCLDSGTTSVKAAALNLQGELVSLSERPNSALRRCGIQVEQDMAASLEDALRVLHDCVLRAQGRALGLILTGQGEGLWPLDRQGRVFRPAITWLDGRAALLATDAALRPALTKVAGITGSRPTAASPSLQALWLQRSEPDQWARTGHVLRAKEWLFHGLTGEFVSEPSTAILAWGNWRTQQLSPQIEEHLGLAGLMERLPVLERLAGTSRPLQAGMAAQTGLPQGLPVLLGPSDVQTTAIGLGAGVLDDVQRASIFGTSAVHIGHFASASAVPAIRPAGSMVQASVREGAVFCIFPGLNGTTSFRHLHALTGAPEQAVAMAPSGIVLQPFFEPGGERAPVTNPAARAALLGMSSQSSREEMSWAGREALAFNARLCHDAMGAFDGRLAFGGGLAQEADFAPLLATVFQRPVWRPQAAHAGLLGLGLLAASVLCRETPRAVGARWLKGAGHLTASMEGPHADYAQRKFSIYSRMLEVMQPLWTELAELQRMAQRL